MAQYLKSIGMITIEVPMETRDAPVTSFSIGTASGPLGSVIHGTRIELQFFTGDSTAVKLSLPAADALQIAEEIRSALHRRDDVRRA